MIQPSIPELIEIEYAKIEKRRLFDQKPLPGLEDYVCTFECLTNCLLDDGSCYWDDPGAWDMWDEVLYPEFFDWRLLHEELARPEPKDPLQTRCPRCFSAKVVIGSLYIGCKNCDYNEVLMDFPENVGKD